MGLPKAIAAHAKGDLDTARTQYERALNQDVRKPVLFQNYGSLLKDAGEVARAAEVYVQGISIFPDHPGIMMNYANLLRPKDPYKAFNMYSKCISLHLRNRDSVKAAAACCMISCMFRENNLLSLSYLMVKRSIDLFGVTTPLLTELIFTCNQIIETGSDNPLPESFSMKSVYSLIEANIVHASLKEKINMYLALSTHKILDDEFKASLDYYGKASDLMKSIPLKSDSLAEIRSAFETQSWNFSNALLKSQYLRDGWRLYEYGLVTPAEGKQKWQRALFKPFSADLVPLWRGESHRGKSLLVLEEQAIGDSMLFFTILPTICAEADAVTIFVGKRLFPIYKKVAQKNKGLFNLTVMCTTQLDQLSADHSQFDFQVPCGSICQHRFTSPEQYAPLIPFLVSDSEKVSNLRELYLSKVRSSSKKINIVGISWRGGSKSRMQKKSLPIERFASILRDIPDTLFVSLQYGNGFRSSKACGSWNQCCLDTNIKPIKDLTVGLIN